MIYRPAESCCSLKITWSAVSNCRYDMSGHVVDGWPCSKVSFTMCKVEARVLQARNIDKISV